MNGNVVIPHGKEDSMRRALSGTEEYLPKPNAKQLAFAAAWLRLKRHFPKISPPRSPVSL